MTTRKQRSTPTPTLTSSKILALIQNGGKVSDNPLPPTHEEELAPITIESLAADIQGLSRQLESQEDQLVSISDGIGNLDEKLYELREAAAKVPSRSMIEALSEKLGEVRELLEERGGGGNQHVEWEE
jgi:methyl-accepting chemotaxis protein